MSASVSIVLDQHIRYDTHLPPWQGSDGVHQVVQLEGAGWHFTAVQGTAAQLRAFAAALNEAAGQADAWAAAHPNAEVES